MLDSKTLEIVKSSAPVLKKHSKKIGEQFYKLLFAKAPELYNIFNQTNQKRGIQQEALVYSVYAAGENIDSLDKIKPLVKRITEKHRALGVQPNQYPVVGETLLQAVKDVLGKAATDEIISAWGQAYNYIADVFISIEQDLYNQTEHREGGWLGSRDFFVDKKVNETDEVASFYLKPKDEKAIASFNAGQYLTLKANIEGEQYTHIRHYSLSDAPEKDYYRISVKREQAHGKAPEGIVSNYLHHVVSEGDLLQIAAPAGDFTLTDDGLPIVLISGGIGITPVLSMFKTLANSNSDCVVTFIHATLNSTTYPLRKEVHELVQKHDRLKSFVCYEKPSKEDQEANNYDKKGYIDSEWLKKVLPNNQCHFYFCGPVPFMKAINSALKEWGVPKERSHYEVFNPISLLEEA